MTTTADDRRGWRTVDIVVAAIVAVAFGVVFLAWNTIYVAADPIFAFLRPAQAILYGVWLLPGVLIGLILRRPGAAFFGGLVSAAVSMVLGSPWGGDVLVSGALQGAGAELGFAIGLYRRWNLPFAMLAGAMAGVPAAIHDIAVYYPDTGVDFWAIFFVALLLSGVIVAGIGSWYLLRTLVATGVLAEFEVGRGQREV